MDKFGYTHRITFVKKLNRGVEVTCQFSTVKSALKINLRGLAANKDVIRVTKVEEL